METKNCENCGKEFTYEPNPKYPRKYCDECSAFKKQQWNAKNPKGEQPVPVVKPGESVPKKTVQDEFRPKCALETVRIAALKMVMERTAPMGEINFEEVEKIEAWILR